MSENELTGEPKNVFINSLIGYNNNLEIMLYINRVPCISCFHALIGFVNMLDEDSKKKLEPTITKLNCYNKNPNLVKDRVDLYAIHREIMNFLHSTYLREIRFAQPKHRGGKLEV